MKQLIPLRKRSIQIISIIFLMIISQTLLYAQGGSGIDQATNAMSGLLGTAYKFLTIIVAIIALVFAMQALGQIKQGKQEGWTKLMSIVLVVAIWLFAIPPFINKVASVSGGTQNQINTNSGPL